MITEEQALRLLEKYEKRELWRLHAIKVSEFAYDLAKKIKKNHPELDVDPKKVRVGGILHDIGKGKEGVHELNSIQILKDEGLPDIAEVVRHGHLYEISVLEGKPDDSLLPKGLENKIVVYSDARVKLKTMTLKDRFDDVRKRRSKDKILMKALDIGMARFKEMEHEIISLAESSDDP